MKRYCLRLGLALVAIAHTCSSYGAWDEMRSGMSRADAAEAVGQPAIIGLGRGFETWSFDHGGEVLLYRGSVLYWTVPKVGAELAPVRSPARPNPTLTKDQPASKPVTRPAPPVLHAAHNCLRVDCPIHSPLKQPVRK